MVKVKFVGMTCMVLNGQFIYPCETREIEESLFERITRERPGLLVAVDAKSDQASGETAESSSVPPIGPVVETSAADETDKTEAVADDNSVEHVEQSVARRRGRAK